MGKTRGGERAVGNTRWGTRGGERATARAWGPAGPPSRGAAPKRSVSHGKNSHASIPDPAGNGSGSTANQPLLPRALNSQSSGGAVDHLPPIPCARPRTQTLSQSPCSPPAQHPKSHLCPQLPQGWRCCHLPVLYVRQGAPPVTVITARSLKPAVEPPSDPQLAQAVGFR